VVALDVKIGEVATNRLEILKEMVAQDPTNSFARYGLAMEFANTGDLAAAVNEFRGLIDQNSNYAAAYYHGGQSLEKLGRIEEARDLYEKGIEATRRSGDAHTRGEIEAALNLLPL
jgi:tetratricopeptide (TPR) repeat protein